MSDTFETAPNSLAHLPVSLFGAAMGLEGLGLAARDAPLPGLPIFAEFFVVSGLLALVVLLGAYAVKLMRFPAAVKNEFLQPAQMGFCATLPLALTLCGGGLWPYSMSVAQALWWGGCTLLLCYQAWALSRWIQGGIELGQVNGGWMMIMIGGIVVPGTGIALGNAEMSRFLFGLSAVATPFVMGLVFHRTVVGPPLPPTLRPTWFIFLVPPSLIYANGELLSGGPSSVFLNGSFYAAMLLLPALLFAARGFTRWPFAASWWAFTFPLDALAAAASRYARLHPGPLWESLFGLVLLLATGFVLMTGWKTLKSFCDGTLLAAPAPASSPRVHGT